jgi:hypothetical protein
MIFMAKSPKKKRRLHEKRFSAQPERIQVDTTSAKFKKEERESEQREQEAARDSDLFIC